MNVLRRIKTLGTACATTTFLLLAGTSHGALTAAPDRVTFLSPDQSFTIALANDGVPLPAADIKSWQFLAGGHDYKHMINIEKKEGAIELSSSNTVELGSYDLTIDTTRGSVVVRVLTPFTEVPDIVEKMTALTGKSEQKIQEKLGLTSSSGRSDVQIDLPPVYYEGQTLKLTMSATPGDGHACMWFINGDAVAEGPDQYAFTYTFLEPGDYVLTYIETATDNATKAVVAHAKAYTRVVPVPPVPTQTTVNTNVAFSAPSGYAMHAWSIDGQPASEEAEFTHKFLAPGTHLIECLASAPDQGPAKGFSHIRYKVTVGGA